MKKIIAIIFITSTLLSCSVTGQTTAQKVATLQKAVIVLQSQTAALQSSDNGLKGDVQTLQNQMKVVQDQLADIFKQLNAQQKQIDSILSYRVIFSKDFRVDSIDVLTTEIYLNTQR